MKKAIAKSVRSPSTEGRDPAPAVDEIVTLGQTSARGDRRAKLSRNVFSRATDEGALREAIDVVERFRMRAVVAAEPIKNAHRDIAPRLMSTFLRSDLYAPSPVRTRKMRDARGRVHRLPLPDVWDRAIGHSVVTQLGSWWKPNQKKLANVTVVQTVDDALAAVVQNAAEDQRWWWLAVDIDDPFARLPKRRAIELFARCVHDAKLVRLVELFVSSGKPTGVIPLQPISRILLDMFLGDALDRHWDKSAPTVRLVRGLGHLLLMAKTEREAESGKRELIKNLAASGMILTKSSLRPVDVRRAAITYLGMTMTAPGGKVRAKASRTARFDIADLVYLGCGRDTARRSATARRRAPRPMNSDNAIRNDNLRWQRPWRANI